MKLQLVRDLAKRSLDGLVAALIFTTGVLEVSVGSDNLFPGSPAVHIGFMAAATLPLVRRRSNPGVALLIVSLATVIYSVDVYELAGEPPIEPFLALLVALYSCALYGKGRADTGYLIAGSAVLLVESGLAVSGGRGAGHAIPPLAFYAGAILFGRFMRHRKAMVEYLEEHAVSLEKNRERDLQYAIEHERGRIARELHDVIAHCLSVIVVQASAESRLLTDAEARTRTTLTSIEEAGRQAMVELRGLLGVIRKRDDDAPLTPQPGLEAVPMMVEQIRDAGLQVTLDIRGDRPEVPHGIDLSAYRIIQEALTNVVKHAQASTASVSVVYAPRQVTIEVTDDGRGPNGESISGFGLIGIKERVALYGGVLRTGNGSDGGFRVHCVLPIEGP